MSTKLEMVYVIQQGSEFTLYSHVGTAIDHLLYDHPYSELIATDPKHKRFRSRTELETYMYSNDYSNSIIINVPDGDKIRLFTKQVLR